MSRRVYVTGTRLARLSDALSRRDWEVVCDVAKLNLLSGQQLRRLHYPNTEAGRRLARLDFARLVEWRVIARLGRSIGGKRAGSEGFVYALDVAGKRLVDQDQARYRAPWTPQPNHLRHALAVSELYAQLRTQAPQSGITLIRFDAEPACWRSFPGIGGGRMTLKPDAFIVTHDSEFEDRYFIELDRATEATTRIAEKARTYICYWQTGREEARTGVFPEVLWLAPDERRRVVLVETLARLPPEHWQLFAVTTHASASRHIIGQEQITSSAGKGGES